jgi:hypothetical protein
MAMHPSRDDLQQLRGLATELNDRTENEAETRHKIIDLVLHSILAWPREGLTD